MLTSPLGYRTHPITGLKTFHRGIDLVVTPGDGAIKAFVEGLVVYAAPAKPGIGIPVQMGNVIAIQDKYDHTHVYAHLSAIVVKFGQIVEAGQMIGRQGSTGASTGNHLHYEIRNSTVPHFGWKADDACVVEPTKYLNDYYAKQLKTVNVVVNNKKFKGLLIDGQSYGPLRSVGEALGATVRWDSVQHKAYVNSKPVDGKVISGLTYIPIRKLASLLNASLDWDNDTKTATLTK
jgi:hypothetical protein